MALHCVPISFSPKEQHERIREGLGLALGSHGLDGYRHRWRQRPSPHRVQFGCPGPVRIRRTGRHRRRPAHRRRRARPHAHARHGPAADRQPRLPRPARGGRRRSSRANDVNAADTGLTVDVTFGDSGDTDNRHRDRRCRPALAGRLRDHRRRIVGRLEAVHRPDRGGGRHPVLAGQHVGRLHRRTTTTACTCAPLRPTCCRARCSAT